MVIEGIILAAGLSQRAGTHKMILKMGESTVIEECLKGMYDFCSRIIVIGGYKVENLVPVLNKYKKVELVLNPAYEEGMFNSVKVGMRQIIGDRFFFTPGDYPMIKKQVYASMLACDGNIVVPVYEGKRGHPVLMNGPLAGELLADHTHSNLREFIHAKGYKTVNVHDSGILLDIDTMDDYKQIIKKLPRS